MAAFFCRSLAQPQPCRCRDLPHARCQPRPYPALLPCRSQTAAEAATHGEDLALPDVSRQEPPQRSPSTLHGQRLVWGGQHGGANSFLLWPAADQTAAAEAAGSNCGEGGRTSCGGAAAPALAPGSATAAAEQEAEGAKEAVAVEREAAVGAAAVAERAEASRQSR